MKIGELADETGVPTKTIRFWEFEGLLPEPDRTPSGYRNYTPDAASRLSFIRQAQTAGFTLRQIGQILDISDGGAAPCEHVTGAVSARLAEIDARIVELQATRTRLQHLARRAKTQDPAACEGICSIIA